MPMNDGTKEAAILVFATPKKPNKGVTPPTSALMEKSKMSGLPEEYNGKEDMQEEECEHCEGKGCPECKAESYEEGEQEGGDSMHMGMIGKLISLLEKTNQGE